MPGLPNKADVVNGGITAWRTSVPAEFVAPLEKASINALKNAYYAPIALL
jgi:hypothetical protein